MKVNGPVGQDIVGEVGPGWRIYCKGWASNRTSWWIGWSLWGRERLQHDSEVWGWVTGRMEVLHPMMGKAEATAHQAVNQVFLFGVDFKCLMISKQRWDGRVLDTWRAQGRRPPLKQNSGKCSHLSESKAQTKLCIPTAPLLHASYMKSWAVLTRE